MTDSMSDLWTSHGPIVARPGRERCTHHLCAIGALRQDRPVHAGRLATSRRIGRAGVDGQPHGVPGRDTRRKARRRHGRQADDRYAPIELAGRGRRRVVLVGDVEIKLLGATPRWDRVAVVKYPTRRAFIEMPA